jgi:hypothetical protein
MAFGFLPEAALVPLGSRHLLESFRNSQTHLRIRVDPFIDAIDAFAVESQGFIEATQFHSFEARLITG